GRQPPHTLCPSLITRKDNSLFSVLGTMGGDAQPQIILQLVTRLLRNNGATRKPAEIVDAGRWVLRGPTTGFDTWTSQSPPTVQIEGHAPESWFSELASRGHQVEQRPRLDSGFGHANMIVIDENGNMSGGADGRTVVGSCE
ncbi:MAG: gamma-glutamyltransferase, partial [Acidimicrobiaceae bacterium]